MDKRTKIAMIVIISLGFVYVIQYLAKYHTNVVAVYQLAPLAKVSR